ncbi:winged helix-turn-helix transcriptional regulator [Agromyces sp. MMS24-JH15]|uniref:winged helix-turn-helix transcriptional regulator n=1 Tax=Agromyces sp. MMS24-JH15 TaxID=3243765 RepID=UPI0037489A36
MPRRVGDFRGLTQPSRLRLLRAIQREPGLRVRDLAEACGLPQNTVRDHLQVLEREGLIRSEAMPTRTRGRPPVGYHPVRDAASSEVARERIADARRRGALLRAAIGAADSPGEIDAHEETAARDDGLRAQLDVLYEHLDDAGLEPEADESALTFDLAPCRYHDLLDEDTALVCATHAQLVRDVLGQVDGPLALRRVEPFVTAHRCRVELTRRPSVVE